MSKKLTRKYFDKEIKSLKHQLECTHSRLDAIYSLLVPILSNGTWLGTDGKCPSSITTWDYKSTPAPDSATIKVSYGDVPNLPYEYCIATPNPTVSAKTPETAMGGCTTEHAEYKPETAHE